MYLFLHLTGGEDSWSFWRDEEAYGSELWSWTDYLALRPSAAPWPNWEVTGPVTHFQGRPAALLQCAQHFRRECSPAWSQNSCVQIREFSKRDRTFLHRKNFLRSWGNSTWAIQGSGSCSQDCRAGQRPRLSCKNSGKLKFWGTQKSPNLAERVCVCVEETEGSSLLWWGRG